MQILFVGTGTPIPGNNRVSTSVFIESEGTSCLLDIGPGILSRLGQLGINPHNLTFIFVSHFHLDHIADLTTLLFISKVKGVAPPLILGPSGLSHWIKRAEKLYDSQIKGNFTLTVNEFEPGETMTLKDLRLSFFKTYHTEESLGIILESHNKKLVYTSDTGYDISLIKELPPAPDILITECSLPRRVEGHMDPENLTKLVQLINPKVLAVVHLYPVIEPERIRASLERSWNGRVIIPNDGFVLNI